ncbi:AlbA family DNA-binding domain-containing protein [Laceyella tengchongensis]
MSVHQELIQLIQAGKEGLGIDFKRTEYTREKQTDLIKDLISMANAPFDGKRYIIIGVDVEGDCISIFPLQNITDDAEYQQLVREFVEPTIPFTYYDFEYEGKTLAVFEIKGCENPPYMIKKDLQRGKTILKKGDSWIRTGSRNDRLSRRDLDDLVQFRNRNQEKTILSIDEIKKMVYYSHPNDWTWIEEDIAILNENPMISLNVDRSKDRDYYEEWLDKFVDNKGRYKVYRIQYFQQTINTFDVVVVDGGRKEIPVPKLYKDRVESFQIEHNHRKLYDKMYITYEQYNLGRVVNRSVFPGDYNRYLRQGGIDFVKDDLI